MKFKMNLDGAVDMPPASCVYAIKGYHSKSLYIGSTKHFRGRMRAHIYALRANKHHSVLLQRAWNKYGEANFTVQIILLCKKGDLLLNEQAFLDREKQKNKSYNLCFVAGNCAGVKQSPETKEKRAAKIRGTKRTPEQCERISAARKKSGISPEHQRLLNKISSQRAFRLSKKQAQKYVERHLSGDRWAILSAEAGCNPKAFRREIKRHIKNKRLLKPSHYTPNLKGEMHPMAKLDEEDVLQILRSKKSSNELAVVFNVTRGHINDIRGRRCWKTIHA